jgi:hypothetical protein
MVNRIKLENFFLSQSVKNIQRPENRPLPSRQLWSYSMVQPPPWVAPWSTHESVLLWVISCLVTTWYSLKHLAMSYDHHGQSHMGTDPLYQEGDQDLSDDPLVSLFLYYIQLGSQFHLYAMYLSNQTHSSKICSFQIWRHQLPKSLYNRCYKIFILIVTLVMQTRIYVYPVTDIYLSKKLVSIIRYVLTV